MQVIAHQLIFRYKLSTVLHCASISFLKRTEEIKTRYRYKEVSVTFFFKLRKIVDMSQQGENEWESYSEEEMKELIRICEEAERREIASTSRQNPEGVGKHNF
jgi:hypothetical protein